MHFGANMKRQTIFMEKAEMKLLPPARHLCQQCAWEHPPEQPHNKQTLFYQVKFEMENNRPGTWNDAMSHCTPDIQKQWKEHLRNAGEIIGDELLFNQVLKS